MKRALVILLLAALVATAAQAQYGRGSRHGGSYYPQSEWGRYHGYGAYDYGRGGCYTRGNNTGAALIRTLGEIAQALILRDAVRQAVQPAQPVIVQTPSTPATRTVRPATKPAPTSTPPVPEVPFEEAPAEGGWVPDN